MEDITIDDIDFFRKILKLTAKDSNKKIKINFDKYSVRMHPSFRKEQKYIDYFEQLVIASEFLIYHNNNQKAISSEQIVSNWNSTEKERVYTLIDEYKSMSLKDYKKAVEPKFLIITLAKSCMFIFLGLTSLAAVFVILLFTTQSNTTALGVAGFLAAIIIVVVYAFRGTSNPNFWRRR
jgi:hypothetical protein